MALNGLRFLERYIGRASERVVAKEKQKRRRETVEL